MTGGHSFSSADSGAPRFRTGTDVIRYEKSGHVFYKGHAENEGAQDSDNRGRYTTTNPQQQNDDVRGNGDARGNGFFYQFDQQRPADRSHQSHSDRDFERSLNERASRTQDTHAIDRELAERGYKIVGEGTLDRNGGGVNHHHSNSGSHSNQHTQHDLNPRGYHRYDRRLVDHDVNGGGADSVYRGGESVQSSMQSRPLPRLPHEAGRQDNLRDMLRTGTSSGSARHGRNLDKEHLVADTRSLDSHVGGGVGDNKLLYVPFFFLGFLLCAVCGVINLLFCDDFQYYFRFWTGALVLLVGVFGAAHRGRFHSHTLSLCFLTVCGLAAVSAKVGLALIADHLVPETVLVHTAHNFSEYAQQAVTDKPYSGVNNPDVVAVICFAFDWVAAGSILVSMTTLSVACVVLHHYYTANFYVSQQMNPFCRPFLFNPEGHVQAAQAACVLGIIAVYTTVDSDYSDYWGPVWAGALSIIAGFCTSLALKRHDAVLRNSWALLAEFLAGLACIAAIVLCVLGFVKNISATQKNQISLEEDLSITSAVVLALTAAALLVNVFFVFAQIVRLCANIYAQTSHRRHKRLRAEGGNHQRNGGSNNWSGGNNKWSGGNHHRNGGSHHGRGRSNLSLQSFSDIGYPHQHGPPLPYTSQRPFIPVGQRPFSPASSSGHRPFSPTFSGQRPFHSPTAHSVERSYHGERSFERTSRARSHDRSHDRSYNRY